MTVCRQGSRGAAPDRGVSRGRPAPEPQPGRRGPVRVPADPDRPAPEPGGLPGRAAVRPARRRAGPPRSGGRFPPLPRPPPPRPLAPLPADPPNVRLAVKTGTSEEILEMVLHDRVQLGIMRSLVHTEIESVPLYTDDLVLIPGPGHPLARPGSGRQARLADLAGEVLVLFGRSSSFLEFTTATFRQAGVLPRSVLELDNIEAAKKMVERGL